MMTPKESLDLMEWSMDQNKAQINEMIACQESYDNRINPDTWPTNSMVPTAQQFIMTEDALGPALDGLFPETNGVQLVPNSVDITEEQWTNAEWALWTQVSYTMKMRGSCMLSVKDCFKCGIGYGIVEPHSFMPDVSKTLISGKKKSRVMAKGTAETGIRYRYVSPGAIAVYPKGSEFDGPYATPTFWFYDPYPAWDIKAMYEGLLPHGLKEGQLKSTYAEVEKAAKSFMESSGNMLTKFYHIMSGEPETYNMRDVPDGAPMEIPIIKVFEQPSTWSWIVPDGSGDGIEILRIEDDVQQMSSGMIKWSATPDGKRWYPMSMAEANRMRSFTSDLFFNFMIDMMDRSKNAVRVIDKSALPPGESRLSEYEDIYVSGSAREAASYMATPNIDPSLANIGGMIAELGNDIRGKTDFAQKNFTRGGTNAFSDLLNTMQSRERLGVSILETGALTKIFEIVFAYMQKLSPDLGADISRVTFDSNNNRILEVRTITSEDIRHSYGVDLDLSTRRMLGGMSFEERMRLWTDMRDRKDVRPKMVSLICPLPSAFLEKVFMSKEGMEKVQAEDRQIELLNAMQPQAGAGQGGAPQGAQQGLPQGQPQQAQPLV
jgi:hypothetical protein